MTCEPDKQPTDPALGRCKLVSKTDFDPNGISGGSVFAIVYHITIFILKFAGVINRSGNGLIT